MGCLIILRREGRGRGRGDEEEKWLATNHLLLLLLLFPSRLWSRPPPPSSLQGRGLHLLKQEEGEMWDPEPPGGGDVPKIRQVVWREEERKR